MIRPGNEVQALREQLAVLKAEAATNETILRRAQAREMELLEADSLESLLERLVAGLGHYYGLRATSLVLCDPEYELRHLLLASGAGNPPEGVIFVGRLDEVGLPGGGLAAPWLGPFQSDRHVGLFPGTAELGSVALLPLRRRHRTVGCLCFGSTDRTRYTRHLAVDFLQHLAVIASFSLENATNRARLVWSGFTDVLTGARNRRYLETRLEEELARAAREGSPLAYLLIDADFFKRVNDDYGHRAGDQVLRELARRIDSAARASDVVARYGGEEFSLLLPATELAAATQLAERLRRLVCATPFAVDEGQELAVTVSIGVSAVRLSREAGANEAGKQLFEAADLALYAAKEAGRNCVRAAGQPGPGRSAAGGPAPDQHEKQRYADEGRQRPDR